MPAVTPVSLPSNLDATHSDAGDATAKAHQQHHDRLHLLALARPINVRDYGALGDGSTNDGPAIQAALDAVPATGGIVEFPPGDFVTLQALRPKTQTILRGCHTPRYHVNINPESACKIRVGTGFVGAGLIDLDYAGGGNIRGLTLQNLCLAGNGIGTSVHGIKSPSTANHNGEQGFSLTDVTIAGFTGSGIYGRCWVWTITNCRINSNTRYGAETGASTTDRWNDVKVVNTYFFYNRMGGLLFDGGDTGYVSFVACRFERSGQTFMNPSNSPVDPLWNADAAGVRMHRATLVSFLGCTSDANSGPGYDVWSKTTALDSPLRRITFTSCFANRDGGGAQGASNPTGSSGFRVRSDSATDGNVARSIHFIGCETQSGPSNDDGDATKLISPEWGVHFENSFYIDWLLGEPQGRIVSQTINYIGDLFGSNFVLNDDGVLTTRNKLGVAAQVATGYSSQTMWRSDATAAVAAQGASVPTTLTELDAATTGARHNVSPVDTGIQFQLAVNARITTAVTNNTTTISVRQQSNTANILCSVAVPAAATGAQTVKSAWVTRPAWFNIADTVIAVYMQSSTGAPSMILKDVSLRWKGGGA